MFDAIPAQWVAAFVVGLVTMVGNKLWNKASEKTKEKITTSISTLGSIMSQIALTADPTMTVERLIKQLKAASAVQLAKIGLTNDNPVVAHLIDDLIAGQVEEFVANHEKPHTLELPITKKIDELTAKAAPSV